MNIKFRYLYRDGANYKQFNDVVFSNSDRLSPKEIELLIQEKLIDGQWFVAKDWGVADMHFKEYGWDSEIDHDWHEFNGVEETVEEAKDNRDIKELLSLVGKTKLPW